MSKRKTVKNAFTGEEYVAVPPYPAPPPSAFDWSRVQSAYPASQPPAYPAPAPPDMHSVSISVLSSHGATVAKAVYASVYNTGIPVSASGEAKREPGDKHDRETGQLLATSRALEILAGKLRREANSRIRHAEAVKRHREEVRKRDKLRELAGTGPAAMAFRTVGPVHVADMPKTGKKKKRP